MEVGEAVGRQKERAAMRDKLKAAGMTDPEILAIMGPEESQGPHSHL
jgi:hypothetical protein